MKLELNTLILINFKGIKSYTFNPQRKNCQVIGINETGKTTLYDAYCWLLLDIDSQGKTIFEICPVLQQKGRIIEPQVEGIFTIDKKQFSLKKIYHGNKKKENPLNSNPVISYFINDFRKTATEYKDYIYSIIRKDLFRILTQPGYFNTKLSCQERRQILFNMCNNTTDKDIVASKSSFTPLLKILDKYQKIEDYIDNLIRKKKEINGKKKIIPAKIDEYMQVLSEDNIDIDIDIEQANILKIEQEIDQIQTKIYQLSSKGAIAEKRNELALIESQLLNNQIEYDSKEQQKIKSNQEITDQIRKIENRIKDSTNEIYNIKKLISQSDDELEEIRSKWQLINEEKFEDQREIYFCEIINGDCPKSLKEKATILTTYNINRSNRLESLMTRAKEISNLKKKEIAQFIEKNHQFHKLKDMIKDLTQHLQPLTKENKSLTRKKLLQKKSYLQNEIELLKSGKAIDVNSYELKLTSLKEKHKQKIERIQREDLIKKMSLRVEELKNEERKFANEYEKLEKELFLCEDFIKTKLHILENEIHSKFKLARFKFFKENGSKYYESCCETIYKGVSYSKGLNTGMKNNIDLDIIKTLSEHFDIYLPCFIDNAESNTKLLSIPSQMIKLIVPPNPDLARLYDFEKEEFYSEKMKEQYKKLIINIEEENDRKKEIINDNIINTIN